MPSFTALAVLFPDYQNLTYMKQHNIALLFLFINSDILGNHSRGIDTAFATMSDQPTHNLEILGQPSAHCDLDNLTCHMVYSMDWQLLQSKFNRMQLRLLVVEPSFN